MDSGCSTKDKRARVKRGLSADRKENRRLISHLKIIINWLGVIKKRSLAAACPVSNNYRDESIIRNELIGRLIRMGGRRSIV